MSLPAYQLRRAKRKTIAIHVRDGQVEVRAPWYVPALAIERFVSSKSLWIEQQLRKSPPQAADAWFDGATLPYDGEHWCLRWQPHTGRAQWRVAAEIRTYFFLAPAWCDKTSKRLYKNWLMQQASQQLLPALHAQAALMGVDHALTGTVFRFTRSMWGRCSARGEVLLNPAILLAGEQARRYLLVHELAHLRHMNHSPAFWQLVAEYCPDWQQARAGLRACRFDWLYG